MRLDKGGFHKRFVGSLHSFNEGFTRVLSRPGALSLGPRDSEDSWGAQCKVRICRTVLFSDGGPNTTSTYLCIYMCMYTSYTHEYIRIYI